MHDKVHACYKVKKHSSVYKTDMKNKMFIKCHISLCNLHHCAIYGLSLSAVKLRRDITKHVT